MIASSLLQTPTPPWIIRSDQSLQNLLDQIRHNVSNAHIVVLDGSNMINYKGLYREFSEKLEFPDYFGHNLNAWVECLTDLDWLDKHNYVLIITDSGQLLSEKPDEKDALLDDLMEVCEEWSKPVNLGESWDRDAVPFHVILLA
ncbi:barstar family protein [Marinobacter maritimus]|uniref:barstar family protein n=1 Tax=Marinobacter maritimus TaxID=277961 RepID=UPI0011A8C671|nr:barstar family protein [Marinobacter maritimus]